MAVVAVSYLLAMLLKFEWSVPTESIVWLAVGIPFLGGLQVGCNILARV